MYLTPSQYYNSSKESKAGNGGAQAKKLTNTLKENLAIEDNASSHNNQGGSSAVKQSFENGLSLEQKQLRVKQLVNRSPQTGTAQFKVKTETDWHKGSSQLMFDNSNLNQANQLYRVSN